MNCPNSPALYSRRFLLVLLAGLCVVFSGLARAQDAYSPPAGYYDSANGLSGGPLRNALQEIIDGHTVVSYSNALTALQTTDEAPGDTSSVELIYSPFTSPKSGAGTSWNREHLWPDSRGLAGSGPDYSDLFNLRPCDNNVNSARGNKAFDTSSSSDGGYSRPAHPEAGPDTSTDANSWEPPVSERGDIARALFYMDVRYDGTDASTTDLVLINGTNPSGSQMAVLSTLLRWNTEDPVDQSERRRNSVIYTSYQHNRNPFIDHPEYVASIFGGAAPGATATPMATATAVATATPDTTPSSTFSQNFDGMGSAGTATLPTGFRVDKKAAVRTVGQFASAGGATEFVGGASLSSSATNGIYNFGSGTTSTGPDRAVGFLSSGSATQSGNLYAQFTNTTGGPVSGLSIAFDVEKYRNGTNAAGFRIELLYSPTDASGTYTSTGLSRTFAADADSNGFSPAPGATGNVSGSFTPASPIANGATFYLAFNYSVASGTTTSNAQALAVDNIALGLQPAAPPSANSGAIISEFRFRGPGNTAANATKDEFIELLNTTNGTLNISGWKIQFTSGAALQTVTVNADTIIPARGHYLVTNSTGYSLGSLASANQSFTVDGDDDSGVTLQNAANIVVDAVTAGNSPTVSEQFAFVRENQTAGTAINRATAFRLVSTTISATGQTRSGSAVSLSPTLGAPGPQNTASPVQDNTLLVSALDPDDPGGFNGGVNRVRDTIAGTAGTPTAFGTIRLRRTLTNPVGGRRITAIRFRAVKISTPNGQSSNDSRVADVRLLSSSNETVTLSNGSTAMVQGTILEAPSANPPGGGHNASMVEGALSLATPLEPGTSRSYSFLLGVAKTGAFFVNLNVESLPAAP